LQIEECGLKIEGFFAFITHFTVNNLHLQRRFNHEKNINFSCLRGVYAVRLHESGCSQGYGALRHYHGSVARAGLLTRVKNSRTDTL
jgi:hypothetical protein